MKVFINTDHHVTAIKFCCCNMSRDMVFGRVVAKPWTNHELHFYYVKKNVEFRINHCPWCGARINGGIMLLDDDKWVMEMSNG